MLSWQQAYAGLIPDQYLGALHTSLARREAFWRESIAAGRTQVSLACATEQVVGFIAIGPCRDDGVSAVETGEVTAFYLLPQYWRSGVGRLLWAAGVQCLAEHDYRRVTLWVLSEISGRGVFTARWAGYRSRKLSAACLSAGRACRKSAIALPGPNESLAALRSANDWLSGWARTCQLPGFSCGCTAGISLRWW